MNNFLATLRQMYRRYQLARTQRRSESRAFAMTQDWREGIRREGQAFGPAETEARAENGSLTIRRRKALATFDQDCARAYAERGNITDIRRLNRNQNT